MSPLYVPGRAGRWARAGARWARLLAPGRPAPGLRVSYGWDRIPAPGEPAAGGSGKAQRLAERFPSTPAGLHAALPRLELAAARPAAARSGRPGGEARPSCSTRTASAIRGWAGERDREVNRPLRRALERGRPRPLPECVLRRTSADEFLGEPRGALGDPSQRGRRRRVQPGRAVHRRRARAAARRRPDAGLPARARARDARGARCRRTPTPGCSSPAGSPFPPSRCSSGSGCAAASS